MEKLAQFETQNRSTMLSPSQQRTYDFLLAEYREILGGKKFETIKDEDVLRSAIEKYDEMLDYVDQCKKHEHGLVKEVRIDVGGYEESDFVYNNKSKLIIKLKQNGKCFLIDENQNVISDEFDEIYKYLFRFIEGRIFIKGYDEETGEVYFELGKDKIIKARGEKWREINQIFKINKDFFLDVEIDETDKKKYVVSEKGERLAGPFEEMFSVQLGDQIYYYVWHYVDSAKENTIGDLYLLGQDEPIIRDIKDGDIDDQCFCGNKDGKYFLMQSADNPKGYTEIEFEDADFVEELTLGDGSKYYRVQRNGKEALFSDPQHQLSPWYVGMIYAVEKIFDDFYFYIFKGTQEPEFFSLKNGKLDVSELEEIDLASVNFIKSSKGLHFIGRDSKYINKFVYDVVNNKLHGPFEGEIRWLKNIDDELFFVINDGKTEYISNLKGQKMSDDFDKIMEFEANDGAPYIVGRQGDEIVKTGF